MRGGNVNRIVSPKGNRDLKDIDKEQKEYADYKMQFADSNDKSCCHLL